MLYAWFSTPSLSLNQSWINFLNGLVWWHRVIEINQFYGPGISQYNYWHYVGLPGNRVSLTLCWKTCKQRNRCVNIRWQEIGKDTVSRILISTRIETCTLLRVIELSLIKLACFYQLNSPQNWGENYRQTVQENSPVKQNETKLIIRIHISSLSTEKIALPIAHINCRLTTEFAFLPDNLITTRKTSCYWLLRFSAENNNETSLSYKKLIRRVIERRSLWQIHKIFSAPNIFFAIVLYLFRAKYYR